MFYGFKQDTASELVCSMPGSSSNLYAGTEGIFRSTPPTSPASNSWLVTMITHSNLALAKQIIDSGVLGDSSFPTQTAYLAKSSDPARNVRYLTADNAVFNTRLRGNYSLQRTNTGLNSIFVNSLGLQQGVVYNPVAGSTFVPSAMADNLTSFGGAIFDFTGGQLNLLEYFTAGAAGSYGTVTEPCNYLQKFPAGQNYFYQARGFCLAECYYQSLVSPYMGATFGEPLSAPFAILANASWTGLPGGAPLAGVTNLTLQAQAADAAHPVQQVDLFLDGLWLQTLTNIPPTRNNVLNVVINGHSVNYQVPMNATIKSVATGLTTALNSAGNATKVDALTFGDRIELQNTDRAKTASQMSLSVSSSIGTATTATTFINSGQGNFLDTIAFGRRTFQIAGNPTPGSFLLATITRTTGAQSSISVTNVSGSMALSEMVLQLINQLNTTPDLAGADGVTSGDLVANDSPPLAQAEFNIFPRTLGWDAAQIQANLIGSFTILPVGNVGLDDNLDDLEPRAHLYINAGVTNLTLSFPFNTASLPNGHHELTAVIYEGSHVRTQKRVAQNVYVQNGGLAATFTSSVMGTSVTLETNLQFSVVANTNSISRIELFSSGGSLGFVTGQSNATFSVAATNLDLGLHPFYAIVTATNGKQYRTETKFIRIIGEQPPIVISIGLPPVTLSWPAVSGGSYDVLSGTNVTDVSQIQAVVTATNSVAQWTDTNLIVFQRYYRVRTSN
jgi:hypothetical protein